MARIVRHILNNHENVIIDPQLTIEAKCLFIYLERFTTLNGHLKHKYEDVFKELNVSERRYYFYRRELIKKGYLKILNH